MKVKSLFKKCMRRHCKNKEVVINLSSRNDNSLVWPEKNTGAEQLHSYAPRTLNRRKKKNTRKPKHSIKKMHFIEMFHIEVSVVKPASIIQIPLKFRGQIPYSNTEHVCTHHEKKEKGPWVGPTKVTLSGPVASKREHSAPILPM